jgi:copper chaperone CopZ
MIPLNIERKHIIKAIRGIDSNGIPPGRESRSFFLIFERKQYPPKYLLSLANKFANGEELDPSRFSGGHETNNFLKRLEFDIVEISSSRTIGKSLSSQKKTFERIQKGHDERCPNCKKTIERMLKEIYGNVESNYKLEVSTNVEDYKDFPFYQKLKEILLELQKYRGHKDFVRTPTISRCDFFVPNPGFIVEFDESQHFTSPRKMTLEHYPEKLELGFDKKKCVVLCERINAKDNTPPYPYNDT